ncbi:MAG: hypothetical protein ACTSRD_12805 [Promethearchaeota archaeon]
MEWPIPYYLGFLLMVPLVILFAVRIFRTQEYPNAFAWVSICLASIMVAYLGLIFFAVD